MLTANDLCPNQGPELYPQILKNWAAHDSNGGILCAVNEYYPNIIFFILIESKVKKNYVYVGMTSRSHVSMNYIVKCTQICDLIPSIPIANGDNCSIRLQKHPVDSVVLLLHVHFYKAFVVTPSK